MPRVPLLALLLLAAAAGPALAQRDPAAERDAILAYRLTRPLADKLLAALPEMTRYVIARPDARELIARTAKQSLAERIAQLEADPRAMAIVKRHGLTARDYVVGVPALRMAIRGAEAGAGAGAFVASPENLAFARAHLAELRPKLDAADGRARP